MPSAFLLLAGASVIPQQLLGPPGSAVCSALSLDCNWSPTKSLSSKEQPTQQQTAATKHTWPDVTVQCPPRRSAGL